MPVLMIEVFIFLFLVLVLVILFTFKGDTTRSLEQLNVRLDDLEGLLKQTLQTPKDKPVITTSVPPVTPQVRPVAPAPPKPVQDKLMPPPVREIPPLPVNIPPAAVPSQKITVPEVTTAIEPENLLSDIPSTPGFWERNPDLEKFIGENLFNKIGIAILVLGIGFFLKYAIDKDWINEIGRTFIGFITAGLLLGLSYRLRKTFAAFSSVLVGGGVAVLYFTISIAFHQYHLFSQGIAFGLTILVTAFTVLLSVAYDRQELAVIAVLGGFGAPFFVSTGNGNIIALFTYILILNIGMIVTAWYKKWNVVNVISYVATVVLFGGWLSWQMNGGDPGKPPHYLAGLIFGTCFYVVFFVMNIINNVRNQQRFAWLNITILLSNTLFYYAAGMVLLHNMGQEQLQGLFTALVAVFNCIFAYSLYRNQRVDKVLIFLLIGLVLSFASLTAPVQLHGNYITLFWAAETVLLLWLWQKSGIVLIKYAGAIVHILMLGSLVMDWAQLYYARSAIRMPFLNHAFITGIVVLVAHFMLVRLSRKEDETKPFIDSLSVPVFRTFLTVITGILCYLVFFHEIYYQVSFYSWKLTPVVLGAYNSLALTLLLLYLRNKRIVFVKLAAILCVINILLYPLFYNPASIDVRSAVLAGQMPTITFFVHDIMLMLFCIMLFRLWKALKRIDSWALNTGKYWAFAVIILYLISAGLDHVVVFFSHADAGSQDAVLYRTQRVGYAILWGVYAFVLMYLGLKWKSRTVRIIAIAVFGVTLAKLFLFDFTGLGEGGKIAAFISLGVILLIISFMYQRLKKLLMADEIATIDETTHE
ncbi:DUF2339 domain-containing protein [Chitinophaga sp. Cy-1792]|uniref:DUF2339 domain-containing protein n=1 Tax=Chitinophaga sp. Cy-1792 TaxID=2608339 RepID=UPI00141E8AE5|nr:DUF2339 domain-containing protein [Chitinophaga sp. Cy-1792]NIG54497.1 DUF2339 domain-containing protein [Chitinophaga sp. Cy-1792]